jgi:hypothetical protein
MDSDVHARADRSLRVFLAAHKTLESRDQTRQRVVEERTAGTEARERSCLVQRVLFPYSSASPSISRRRGAQNVDPPGRAPSSATLQLQGSRRDTNHACISADHARTQGPT